jgi:hypothetical protein
MAWKDKNLTERISAVMYPAHASAADRDDMTRIARASGKQPPTGPKLIPDHLRGACSPIGGQAVKSPPTKRRV